MTGAIDITAEQRQELLTLLHGFLPGVEVWAYGSRVKWTAQPGSDLDLVVFSRPEQRSAVAELRDALAESDLPFLVDLHVWDEIPERFHEVIRMEYAVVQEATKASQKRVGPVAELENVRVEEIAAPVKNALVGGPFGSNLVSNDYTPAGVPVIRGTNMGHGRWIGGDFVHVSAEKAASLAANCVSPGDIVFTQRGTLGQVALVPVGGAGKYLLSQSQMKLTVDPAKADALYLYYVFISTEQQDYIRRNAIQTGVPHTNLGLLRNTPLRLPPLAEQRAIAEVLGALDDKIECNRRLNETLEGMARALFQSWFVDFDPVRAKLAGRPPPGLDPATAALFPDSFQDSPLGPIPSGWHRVAIADLCDINARSLGKRDVLETMEYIEISEVSRGEIGTIARYARGTEPSRARRLLHHGDTVLSTVRPDRGAYFLAMDPPTHRVVSTGFAVISPKAAPWAFVHAALTQPAVFEHLGQMADGGAYPAVRSEAIGAIQIVVPKEQQLLRAFQDTSSPLFEQAESNRLQSRSLAALRDSLLPKLLSGELSVAQLPATLSAEVPA